MRSNATGTQQNEGRDLLLVQRAFRLTIAAFALFNCWACRFIMNPDGVSYLDMGDQYWKGNWHVAVNSYWSPLYSWLTGLMLLVIRPSIGWEYPAVHFLNFLILVATLFSFEFFWRELLTWRRDTETVGGSEPYAWALGYLLFAYVHFVIHPLEFVTPDLLVAALVYLISGLMLRFATRRESYASAALLGILLGIGYLAKAAMFPFALATLATMLAVSFKRRESKRLVAVALLGFVVVSLPFMAALSWNYHRATFGDSGKMNVGWLVNGEKPADVLSHRSAVQVDPLHLTRKLLPWPEVYEFATPVAGTFPVWYDPTYWCAAIDTRLHPASEMHALRQNITHLGGYLFVETGFLTAVLLLVFLLSDSIREPRRNLVQFWPVLVPAIAVFMMYAMVVLEPRYFSGVAVVIWGTIVASTDISQQQLRIKVMRAATVTLAGMVIFTALEMLTKSHIKNEQAEDQIVVAERLRSMGMKAGDRVAVIGDGFREASWARLEKVTIIAEVPDKLNTGDSAAAFWTESEESKQVVLSLLKTAGATAVIADTPPLTMPYGWVRLGSTGHAVYFF